MCTVIFDNIQKEGWLGQIMQVVDNIPAYKRTTHKIILGVSSDNTLTEAYYNVFDHADANGIAFSVITFNKETQVLDATICDLGVGMVKPIKVVFPQIVTDEEALRRSIEGITLSHSPDKDYIDDFDI